MATGGTVLPRAFPLLALVLALTAVPLASSVLRGHRGDEQAHAQGVVRGHLGANFWKNTVTDDLQVSETAEKTAESHTHDFVRGNKESGYKPIKGFASPGRDVDGFARPAVDSKDWLGNSTIPHGGLQPENTESAELRRAAKFAVLDLTYGHRGSTFTYKRAPWKILKIVNAASETPFATRYYITMVVVDGLGAQWREQVIVYKDAIGYGEGYKVLKQHLIRLSDDPVDAVFAGQTK